MEVNVRLWVPSASQRESALVVQIKPIKVPLDGGRSLATHALAVCNETLR